MWSAAVLATVVTASLLAANPAKAANVHHMSDHDGARGEKSFHDLAAAWRADSPAFAQLRRAGGWAPTACGFGGANIITTYGKQVDPASVLPEYPRPQMVRAPAAAAAGTPMAATAAESALLSLDGAAVGAAAAMRELSGRMPTTNDGWLNLNGLWEFEFASSTAAADAPFGPPEPRFGQPLNGTILVPFPAEACLSGVGKTGTQLRYRTVFDAPLWPAGVVSALGGEVSHLLHFGSVDWQTEVYLNGQLVANHTGGYDGFSTGDLTSLLKPSGNELLVNVFDPSDTGVQPNGKQRISAIIHPGGDTYTPSSGIWQTVWLEAVPKVHISTLKLRTTTTLLNATVFVDRDTANDDVTATVSLLDESGKAIATGSAAAGTQISIDVSGAGVKLWSDTSPNLYNVSVSITGGDSVLSYVGFREFNLVDVPVHFDNGPQPGVDRPGGDMPGYPVQMPSADPDWCWARCNATSGCEAWATSVPGCDQYKEPMCWLKSSLPSPTSNKCRVSGVEAGSGGTVKQPHLNGAARFMAGWLDQSFWPDGLYTAPTTEGLEFDVAAVKTFGLNMVRLHQKVNPERWYYKADTTGVILFQDMPQKYGGATPALLPFFNADLRAMMLGPVANHPCVVQWEVFNEGDCVAQFNATHMVEVARTLDPTRLIDTDSGGPANNLYVGDVNDIHDYPSPDDPQPSSTQYAMIGEFGGIGAFIAGHEWARGQCHTYQKVDTPTAEATQYIEYAQTISSRRADISASVYTQITDVENECDGFLNYDRTNKFDSADTARIKAANEALVNG